MYTLVIVFLGLLFHCVTSENTFTDAQKYHMKMQSDAFRKKFQNSRIEELNNGIEGDMMTKLRNGLIFKTAQWDDATIPYEIIGPYDSQELDMLSKAFDYYRNNTCIIFRPKTDSDKDYISIVNEGAGCSSFVGRVGGAQEIKLASPCFLKFGTIAHELMHVLGFTHEQNRSDRDKYIKVNFNNIKKAFWNNFKPATKSEISAFGVPYDYQSAMHYGSTAFSNNDADTIIPIYPEKALLMGQRFALTNYDLSKILKMYCQGKKWRSKIPFPYVHTEFDN